MKKRKFDHTSKDMLKSVGITPEEIKRVGDLVGAILQKFTESRIPSESIEKIYEIMKKEKDPLIIACVIWFLIVTATEQMQQMKMLFSPIGNARSKEDIN